jgi:hypothetical protein
MLKRRLKTLCKVLLGLAALLCVFLLFERVRGQISLARYKRELLARGEKLNVQDFMVHCSPEQNGTPEVNAAARQLIEGVCLPVHYPPRMGMTPSGRAVIGFQETEWVESHSTNHWAQLAGDLKTNEPTLDRIRKAMQKPVFNSELDYSLGCKMPITNLATVKTLAHWFGAGSQLALHERDPGSALPHLVALINLPRVLREDRVLISELVRCAIASIARASTWEALQADGWDDASLAALQAVWERQDFAAPLARSLEGERVFDDASYDLMRKSNQDTADVFYGLAEYFPADDSDQPMWERWMQKLPYGEELADFCKKQLYCRIWRFAWSYQDQRRSLERMQRLLEICRKVESTRSLVVVQGDIDRFEQANERTNFYDRLRYPELYSFFSLSKSISKVARAETERSVILCALAVKRYQLRHSRPPTALADLIPDFIARVPTDFFDGQPVRYRCNPDGRFVLYSVGENSVDNGGDASPLSDTTSYYNLWGRKDFVWAQPATPAEVEAWRQEQAKR